MLTESFLVYRNYRYLRLALAVAIASVLWYLFDEPAGGEPPNGGTVVGYTLGTIAALLIVWLTWFGVRKRSYRSQSGSLRGWLSAHVYLGSALLVLATLHTGFQLGLNVHSAAYLLMIAVVISGFFGVVMYVRFPRIMSENRQQMTQGQLVERLRALDAECVEAAASGSEDLKAVVNSAINGTQVGGGLHQQLLANDTSMVSLPRVVNGEWQGETIVANQGQKAVLDWLAGRRATARDQAANRRLSLVLDLMSKRRSVTVTLRRDIQIRALLDVWLYVHVPMSMALLVALTIHIVSVFWFW